MANYNQVSYGSQGSDVKTLQELLNQNGANLSVDGIFGAKTQQAVKDYQKAKGLAVDGIVGKNTWGALTTAQPVQTVPEVAAPEPEKSYRYDYEKDPAYQNAQQKVTELEGSRPTIQGTYDQQVEQLFQELMGQKDFKYDLNGDPLWQQYKDQYTTQGKMAMMDTMGQAAALTGGYGSSYAQGAGQQAYQGYLQQLNDRIPELHQLALQKYAQEQALLQDKFAAAKGMQSDEYAKDMDKLNIWYQDLGLARDDVKAARDYGQNAWYTEEQLRRDDENTAYTKQQNARSELMSMIASTGYTPTDAELETAGMTRGQATALAAQYEWEKGAEARAQSRSEAAEARAQSRNDAATRAEMLAAGGDYSALASLYGMTEEQVAAAYAAQNAPEYTIPAVDGPEEAEFLERYRNYGESAAIQWAEVYNIHPEVIDAWLATAIHNPYG